MATPEIPSQFWQYVYDTEVTGDDLGETRNIFARVGDFPTRHIIPSLGAAGFEAAELVATKIRLPDFDAPGIGLPELESHKTDARWLVTEAVALEETRREIEKYLAQTAV